MYVRGDILFILLGALKWVLLNGIRPNRYQVKAKDLFFDMVRGDALSNNIATADSLRSTLPLMLLMLSATDCYTSENYSNSCHKQLGPW